MKHLFLSKELSLLAKEKGFNEHCFAQYTDGTLDSTETIYPQEYVEVIPAPLYQQIIDWFESKHRIVVSRIPYTSGKHKYQLWIWDTKRVVWVDTHVRAETIEQSIEEAFKLI